MNIKEKQQYLDDVKNLVKGEWSLSWTNGIAGMWQQIASYNTNYYFSAKRVNYSHERNMFIASILKKS